MSVIYKYPIHGRDKNIFAFELVPRGGNIGDSGKINPLVINYLLEEDPVSAFGDKKIFVELSQEFIESAVYELLPSSHVIVKIGKVESLTDKFIGNIKEIKLRGFSLCLSDFCFDKVEMLPLIPISDYVMISWKRSKDEDFKEEINTLKSLGLRVIFKDIESEREFKEALELGDYFQGSFLSSPSLLKDVRSVLFLKDTIIKLFHALEAKNLEDVVRIIESDVGLTYKLLKWVKNFYPGKAEDIQTVSDAVLFLSINNITNFVLALAMAELFAGRREEEIIRRSLFRAHLSQELAKVYIPEFEREGYFIGLFSLMDELIGEEPASLARELNLGQEIVEAYEKRYNEFGLLLSLVELLEFHHEDEEIIKHVGKMLKVPPERIKEAIEKAKEKAFELTR
ncbi:EAL and HDOD domain-containing protein [Aquifex sp.]